MVKEKNEKKEQEDVGLMNNNERTMNKQRLREAQVHLGIEL